VVDVAVKIDTPLRASVIDLSSWDHDECPLYGAGVPLPHALN